MSIHPAGPLGSGRATSLSTSEEATRRDCLLVSSDVAWLGPARIWRKLWSFRKS